MVKRICIRLFSVLTLLSLVLVCLPASASAKTDPGEKIVYGYSGAGRELVAWRYGTGKNVMVLGFAIHGWEDNWNRDGEALVWTADQLRASLSASNLADERGWSVYVLPCMNPDGLYDGSTCDGPGRCTTSYYDASGSLKFGKGIDMNRCFPANFEPITSGSRNYTGSTPLACKEAKALAEFIQSVKGSGTNILFDTHGWYQQTIVFTGETGLLNSTVARHFPGNRYTSAWGAKGYLIRYAHDLGYDACLLELPRGIYSLSAYKSSGYAKDFIGVVEDLIKTKPPVCSSGHQYRETRVEPTCGTPGTSTKVCKICGHTEVTPLPATGKHDYQTTRVEPTCIKPGSVTQVCRVCKDTVVTELPATGRHTYTTITTEPGCETTGLTTYLCTVCNRSYCVTIPALGHTPDPERTTVLEPNTATTNGSGEGPCAVCGKEFRFAIPRVFLDTKAGWYSEAVDNMYASGIISGVSPTAFGPNSELSRAMLVTFLYRMADKPAAEGIGSIFDDVPEGKWYTDAVTWAAGAGIVSGLSEGEFGPNDPVTREQAAAMLFRFAAYRGLDTDARADLSVFEDADRVRNYAVDAISWCVSEGIMSGTAPTRLDPRAHTTRAQAACLCWRLLNLPTPEPIPDPEPFE